METIKKHIKDAILLTALYLVFSFLAGEFNPWQWSTGVKIFAVVVFLLWLVGYIYKDEPESNAVELDGIKYDIDRIKEKLDIDK